MSTSIQFENIYNNKNVFITGHTGFKGSWLALWLLRLGAKVTGYALKPNTHPNHYDLLKMQLQSNINDIRDKNKLVEILKSTKPEIVFHLAAQPLVRYSYQNPHYTYETNVIGTINLLEACRQVNSVKAIIIITSDKCYENKEWHWGYREIDPMGGFDPYSASKGCTELITSSYRNSFFNKSDYSKTHNTLLASVRAGNVIGGGDWSEDRLIPDIMRALNKNEKVEIRYPNSTRPWQHVLDPLSGYLLLGSKLLQGKMEFAEAWNFGPNYEETVMVKDILQEIKKSWPDLSFNYNEQNNQPHEAGYLKLDCSKAFIRLDWKNVWTIKDVLDKTVSWYHDFYNKRHIISENQLSDYVKTASEKGLAWAKLK